MFGVKCWIVQTGDRVGRRRPYKQLLLLWGLPYGWRWLQPLQSSTSHGPAQQPLIPAPPSGLIYGGHTPHQPPPHFFHSPAPSYPDSPAAPFLSVAPTGVPASSTPRPDPGAAVPDLPPLSSVTDIDAPFSEYRDLEEPRYYDLPTGVSVDPEGMDLLSFTDGAPRSQPSVSAIDFVSSDANTSRLVITLTLWSGKRAVYARALIDSGSEGDFVDSAFALRNSLGLLRRKHPITCSSFDGSTAAAGPITHFWSGSMTMIGTESQLFHSAINLNSTRLGGFDMILGASWLRRHEGWVGGAGPALRLFKPVSVPGGSLGEGSSASLTPVPSAVSSSSLCDTSPQTSLPPQFSRFANVFDPQGPSSFPPHRPGYDMKIDLKPDSTPPYVLSSFS